MFLSILKPLAVVSTIALSTLGVLSRKYRRARYAFHLTLYAGTLGFMSVAGVFISLAATIAGQRLNTNYLVARCFYGITSPLVGIRLIVEGGEHLEPEAGREQSAILVGNHQSFLDILYLGRIFPKRASIMAKRELIWAPLLGQYLAASGAVFVDRKDRKNAMTAMTTAGENMKRTGVSLWVFPEGTRSSTPSPVLLPFKKGAFHLAVQAQVPIIPVVCENYHRLFDGSTRFESGDLRIRVLPPISTKGLSSSDVGELAEETRRQMLDALIEISAPGPGQGAERRAPSHTHAIAPAEEGPPPPNGAEGGLVDRLDGELISGHGESTDDDEMDDDVVLIRRPKTE
ncbi:uncharacterized protein MKK02DRAFT_18684 [Dioszegia hungarica]|uniref:1-acyl-sn-glycerol-3-phosphate acyltransferase n=1 Tax=Dioszegia hungarica TaxID=4972 RepID=A0AA38H602_9TREE|nr:uncharacterized protein MKK02DRAFT_18684 [Dioszegia hungarica]KAI9633124.1 hypothetical protein MKK02DRAFT_18684 [Dioszegia hungarica]